MRPPLCHASRSEVQLRRTPVLVRVVAHLHLHTLIVVTNACDQCLCTSRSGHLTADREHRSDLATLDAALCGVHVDASFVGCGEVIISHLRGNVNWLVVG